MRADGIATSPMLRAAIETDAATLGDLANTEMVFTADHGESLEVFQLHGDKPTSLLRIPAKAAALPALKGRTTELHSDGRGVTLVASAPVSGYRSGVAGGLVISTPVDLAAIRRTLGDHAAAATLTGLGHDLVLVEPHGVTTGTPVKLPVPASTDVTTAVVTLIATPQPATGLTWARPARYLSGGLVVLLLAGFAAGLVRRDRS
jgi:hypothetical protein